ncbi:hypothetical protein [Streptomyces sp. NPDC052036]|uniref:hypothetical protein n=1 Tax=Streptomyces sp. NPDC052036 TaxID=3155171 RepID=UPI0034432005
MTQDKKRKAAVRQAQQAGGRRYAALAREMTAIPSAAFQLAQLLAECATRPAVTVDWDFHPEHAPDVFESSLIGTAIPYGSVLQLARRGRSARLTVESVEPRHSTVLACDGRRFLLLISQEAAWDLCKIPQCPHYSAHPAFTHCPDHLAQCNVNSLLSMARDWGHDRHESHKCAPESAGGSTEADALIKASVYVGSCDRVSNALLSALFGDPDLFDEMCLDTSQRLAMQHACERERLRLDDVAHAEVKRLRQQHGACGRCGERLFGWNPGTPALLCRNCAPSPRAAEPHSTNV